MSDERLKVWVRAVPQLVGIAALAAVLLAGIRSDHARQKGQRRPTSTRREFLAGRNDEG